MNIDITEYIPYGAKMPFLATNCKDVPVYRIARLGRL